MRWQRSTTVSQCNTMRWELSPTVWQRNTTHWQRSTMDWNCVSMHWQRTTTHLQCIDNELRRIFKAQRVCVDFSYARFSQIGSQMCEWTVICTLDTRLGERASANVQPCSDYQNYGGKFLCQLQKINSCNLTGHCRKKKQIMHSVLPVKCDKMHWLCSKHTGLCRNFNSLQNW